ncbi:hypothetical protein EDB81DRAFT_764787 [Dactylonectria macrodidyma]|uniref:Uncharacterized protein n=1 Tax=Dactylonectria macrodidyma TaxID=307937 RepID=A0A9P9DYK6_9HYPO|nr:hypothetical protein EDB81DRAFT_764787 [Dactylonectria macrodidyma]
MDSARLIGFIDREPRHYGQLCNCASRLWAQRGDFTKALTFMLESKSIRERIKADAWSAFNNLENIQLSMGDSELALQTHADCMALFGGEDNMPRHALRMNRLNTGRTLTFLKRFDEAAVLIDGADALNEDWLMAIQSLLLRARGELGKAREGFLKSVMAIKQGTPYQELLDAACHYKIGCICMQQGNATTARNCLQISHDIHELRGSSPCEFARVKYMLSMAIERSADLDDAKRSQSLLNEAKEIRFALIGTADGEVAGESDFDMLVESQLR